MRVDNLNVLARARSQPRSPVKGRSIPYRTFDKLRRVTETAVLENKRLGGLLTLIRQSQEMEPPPKRTSIGPRRRDQTGHMFKIG
jgi:hypothetical protein